MSRVLGKSVTVSDSIVDGVPQGRVHTILLEDHEDVPTSPDEVEEMLVRDADIVPAVLDVALEGVVKADPTDVETDKAQVLLAALDELAVSKDASVVDWKMDRLAPSVEAVSAGGVEIVKEP